MAKDRAMSLRFPTGGLDKSVAFQDQRPYTTPEAKNVWPTSQEDGRERGGSRPGLGKALATQLGSGNKIQMLAKVDFIDPADQTLKRMLCAVSNGLLYYRISGSTWTAASMSGHTLANDTILFGAEFLQKLYIADYKVNPITATNGTTGAGHPDNKDLDSASYADWTTEDFDETGYRLVVYSSGNGTAGTYEIENITVDKLTLNESPGDSLTGVHFSIERLPKIYNPATDVLTKWTATNNKGEIPLSNPYIVMWRDRLVLTGGHIDPHNWYMSRSADPHDWLYGDIDAESAVAGNNADAGRIGEPVNAMIPHGNDCLIFGCENSMWALRGDPMAGGSLDNLSRAIGVLDGKAWARSSEKVSYVLTTDGLYMMEAPCGETPLMISRAKLPDDLLFTDTSTHTVLMEYDKRFRGLHVFVSKNTAATATHYWVSLGANPAFWLIELDTDHDPFSIIAFPGLGTDNDSDVILGCRDGYARNYQRDLHQDDGTFFNSYIVYGPMSLGAQNQAEGVIKRIVGVPTTESGTVSWEIYAGKTMQEAADTTLPPKATGQWNGGMNYTSFPRVRGGAFSILVKNTDQNDGWSMEELSLITTTAGWRRK